jgi:ABC-2 type transport system permease protein
MKYWQMYKTFLQKHLTYRLRFFIWTFGDSIYFFVMPFVWLAVYHGRAMVNGYSQADIITYYLIMVFVSLTTSSHIMRIIRTDIMNGDLNNTMLKPLNYCLYRFMHELSYKLLSGSVAVIIFFLAWLFFPQYISVSHNWLNLLLFLMALLVALLLSYALQFIAGFSAFWMGENTGAERLRQVLEIVFSGQIAPLAFYPLLIQKVAEVLPFKFLSFFPAQVYLGQVQFNEILFNLLMAVLWLLFFYLIVWLMWKRGVRRYEGTGM